MQKLCVLLLAGIISFLLNSCEYSDKPADGAEDEIIVIADSLEFQTLRGSLESAFEKTIYTPQPEKLYSLKLISPNQLEEYRTSKNIIVIAPYRSNSKTAKLISAVIDTSLKNEVIKSGEIAVKKQDLWAKNQLVMFLTAPTAEDLNDAIRENKDDLVCSFQKASDKRLISSLYDPRFEKRDAQGKLLKDYGWTIYIQEDFKIAKEDPEAAFVWLRNSEKPEMQRWMFIHWIDNASPDYLNSDSINALRNSLTNRFYGAGTDSISIRIAADYYTSGEVNFKGRYALLTQGLWENMTKNISGPFINYTFYDEKSRRIYMLDGAVFAAPKYYKRNLIQQVDVMLQSFMTESEISPERKRTLLEAAKD
jgi:hypothetical protein